MKCPLFVMSYMLKVGEAPTHQAECIKEECAWWDKDRGVCAVLTLIKRLNQIENAILTPKPGG